MYLQLQVYHYALCSPYIQIHIILYNIRHFQKEDRVFNKRQVIVLFPYVNKEK